MNKVIDFGHGWRVKLSAEKASRVILEGFLEGGLISTSPGTRWVSSPVPVLESSVSSPWPQDWAAAHVFLPDHSNTAFVHTHILKGQQLLQVKSFVWIDVQKVKRTTQCNSAVCKQTYGRGNGSRLAGRKEKCVFFYLASYRANRKCTFVKAEVLKQLPVSVI